MLMTINSILKNAVFCTMTYNPAVDLIVLLGVCAQTCPSLLKFNNVVFASPHGLTVAHIHLVNLVPLLIKAAVPKRISIVSWDQMATRVHVQANYLFKEAASITSKATDPQ